MVFMAEGYHHRDGVSEVRDGDSEKMRDHGKQSKYRETSPK